MPKRKMIVAYACLVGVPLLGLLGILRAGQRLRAPVSVGGAWNLEADFGPLAGKPCGELLADIKPPFFTISQSGPALVVTLNSTPPTTLNGTVQGTALSVAAPEALSAGGAEGCSDPGAVYVTANVEGQGRGRTLAGVVGLRGCAVCAPVPFRAYQAGPSRAGGK